ncbi:MAG: dihydroneopterin triphosphate diphosphatase [Rhodoferax sp.]|nr:dihydroneopterin triphosphate diphosphatase [Rhodoferax sp.]
MPKAFKIPQSVLVVIHTAQLDVLLIKRVDAEGFWQSVTGSKEHPGEDYGERALREVREETGIDCAHYPGATLVDWNLENVYAIYPRWSHRYAPDVQHNTEHLFGLMVPPGTVVRLNPREHIEWRWLPWREAALACFSPSNAEAILMLPRWTAKVPQ